MEEAGGSSPSKGGCSPVHQDDFLKKVYAKLQLSFEIGLTKRYEWRLQQLQGLFNFCKQCHDEIVEAIRMDLPKRKIEAALIEIAPVSVNIRHAMDHLEAWMEPRMVNHPLHAQPGKSEIHAQPKGIVLAIGPCNLPFGICIESIIGPVAAGNCVLLKPSEMTPHVERLLETKLPLYLDTRAFAVVTGGPELIKELINNYRFNHILFTGSRGVAQEICRNPTVANYLTPLTLSLSGKNPVVFLPSNCLKRQTLYNQLRKILYGKTANCGMLASAPDYMLVHKQHVELVVRECRRIIREWYGSNVSLNEDYGRMVNSEYAQRVVDLRDETTGHIIGLNEDGPLDRVDDRFVSPTLIVNPGPHDSIMGQEIFGPLLIVLTYEAVKDIPRLMRAIDNYPLALYVFSGDTTADKTHIDFLIRNTVSGGMMINDTLSHYTNTELPFGGIGDSGKGKHHGYAGFLEFSNQRSVMFRMTGGPDLSQKMPPYTREDLRMSILKRLYIGPIIPDKLKAGVTSAAILGLGFAIRANL